MKTVKSEFSNSLKTVFRNYEKNFDRIEQNFIRTNEKLDKLSEEVSEINTSIAKQGEQLKVKADELECTDKHRDLIYHEDAKTNRELSDVTNSFVDLEARIDATVDHKIAEQQDRKYMLTKSNFFNRPQTFADYIKWLFFIIVVVGISGGSIITLIDTIGHIFVKM